MDSTAIPPLSAFADEAAADFNGQLDAVKRNGITHIEVRKVDGRQVHELGLDEIRSLKTRADDAGVKFSAVGSSLGKCSVDAPLDEQLEQCRHLVDAARELDTPYIRMFSYHIPKDSTPEDCRQQVIDNLGRLVDVVKGTDVILAHENEKNIYGDTAERCRDLYETFYSTGAFKGIFDFSNFVQVEQLPLTDCWPLLKDYTEYFHIKDCRRSDGWIVPAGQGDGGIAPILSEALPTGKVSYLTLEPHLWPKRFGGTAHSRFDLAASALKELLAGL